MNERLLSLIATLSAPPLDDETNELAGTAIELIGALNVLTSSDRHAAADDREILHATLTKILHTLADNMFPTGGDAHPDMQKARDLLGAMIPPAAKN